VDAHRTAQLLGYDDTPQIVDLPDNACCFQINNTSACFDLSIIMSYAVATMSTGSFTKKSKFISKPLQVLCQADYWVFWVKWMSKLSIKLTLLTARKVFQQLECFGYYYHDVFSGFFNCTADKQPIM
jgi:hypothetical protein